MKRLPLEQHFFLYQRTAVSLSYLMRKLESFL